MAGKKKGGRRRRQGSPSSAQQQQQHSLRAISTAPMTVTALPPHLLQRLSKEEEADDAGKVPDYGILTLPEEESEEEGQNVPIVEEPVVGGARTDGRPGKKRAKSGQHTHAAPSTKSNGDSAHSSSNNDDAQGDSDGSDGSEDANDLQIEMDGSTEDEVRGEGTQPQLSFLPPLMSMPAIFESALLTMLSFVRGTNRLPTLVIFFFFESMPFAADAL